MQAKTEFPASPAPLADSSTDGRLLNAVVVQTAQHPARTDGIALGVLDAIEASGDDLVCIAASGLTCVRARLTSTIDQAQIGQTVALGFEAGGSMRPAFFGLMLNDGNIELRGTYITSQASATRRILGGSVNIN